MNKDSFHAENSIDMLKQIFVKRAQQVTVWNANLSFSRNAEIVSVVDDVKCEMTNQISGWSSLLQSDKILFSSLSKYQRFIDNCLQIYFFA